MISCIIHTKSLLISSSISNSNVTCSVSGSGSVGSFGIKSTTSVELVNFAICSSVFMVGSDFPDSIRE